MSKVTFEFDGVEESDDIKFIAHKYDIVDTLDELRNYRRNLYKYETREAIPVNELIDKIDELMEPVNNVLD